MDYSKPTLLVISGPNGAGKPTHIQTMLPKELIGLWSFDRDKTRTEFEGQLKSGKSSSKEITVKAIRMMEEQLLHEMKKAIKQKHHFILETPKRIQSNFQQD